MPNLDFLRVHNLSSVDCKKDPFWFGFLQYWQEIGEISNLIRFYQNIWIKWITDGFPEKSSPTTPRLRYFKTNFSASDAYSTGSARLMDNNKRTWVPKCVSLASSIARRTVSTYLKSLVLNNQLILFVHVFVLFWCSSNFKILKFSGKIFNHLV